jgi:hypothetical protein
MPRLGIPFQAIRGGRRLAPISVDLRGWFVAAPGGWVQALSSRWWEWLKCEEGDLLGHGWTRFVHIDDRHLTVAAVSALQANKCPQPYRQRWVASDGELLSLRVSAWVWVSPAGAVRRVVGCAEPVDADSTEWNGCDPVEDLRAGAANSTDGGTVRRVEAHTGCDPQDDQDAPTEEQSLATQ